MGDMNNSMQMEALLPERSAQRSGLEEITPELIAMAAEYGYITDDQKRQLLQYKQADEMRKTPMPEMRRFGDNHVVAPNAMEVAASTIERYRGGEQEQAAMQKLQADAMRKQQIDQYGLQQDIARRRNDHASLQAEGAPPPSAGEFTGPLVADIPADTTGQDIMHDFSRPVRKAPPPPPQAPPTAATPAIPGVGNVGAPLLPALMPPGYKSRNPWRGFQLGGIYPTQAGGK